MSGFGAKAYSQLGLQTDVLDADPHRLILILFDGALLSISRAKSYLAERRVPQKCAAIGKACEIVDCGLRVSVDARHDPEFAARLVSLYKYIVMRLLQANLRNDLQALDEAAGLLSGLRDAWARIGAQVGSSAAAPALAPAGTQHTPGRAARAVDAYQP